MSNKRVATVRLVELEAFIAVVEEGGYTAAAKALGVDQSTVSRYLTNLEKWAQVPLLTMDVPPDLTAQGEQFLPVAREVVTMLRETRESLHKMHTVPAIRHVESIADLKLNL